LSPVDPLGLVTNLVTLGQLLGTKLADIAARRAVLTAVARAAVDHFGEDAPFIVTEVLGREEVSRQLLAPPSGD
jgi:hypothetical protein